MAGPTYPQHEVPNYLVQAILCTLCCCIPFGIVAIVFAAQVNGRLAEGDYAGAVQASNQAKLWCWIGFGLGLVGNAVIAAFVLLPMILAAAGGMH